MTRTEAIAIITEALPKLDDARVADLAELVQAATGPTVLRPLSDDERAALERSRDDFKAGRTYSIGEARALSDDFLQSLRAKYPGAP